MVLDRPLLVAHRGASAYAPEHTTAAYRLAIEQGADLIEPDLQLTRDGVLIALHDETLERTTNVEAVFPDRFREVETPKGAVKRWPVADFTLEEVRQLDAGSWFRADFEGERIPTLDEVIEIARGRVGVFPETKAPEASAARGLSMERCLTDTLTRHGLTTPGAVPETPVLLQSFSERSLRILGADMHLDLPRILLVDASAGRRLTPDGLAEVVSFATGIGPDKRLLRDDPSIIEEAHAAGLAVIPWTFGTRDLSAEAVTTEMERFVCEMQVDGLFTDNPDLFPSGC